MEKAEREMWLQGRETLLWTLKLLVAQLFTFVFTKQTSWPGSVWKSVSCLLMFVLLEQACKNGREIEITLHFIFLFHLVSVCTSPLELVLSCHK